MDLMKEQIDLCGGRLIFLARAPGRDWHMSSTRLPRRRDFWSCVNSGSNSPGELRLIPKRAEVTVPEPLRLVGSRSDSTRTRTRRDPDPSRAGEMRTGRQELVQLFESGPPGAPRHSRGRRSAS